MEGFPPAAVDMAMVDQGKKGCCCQKAAAGCYKVIFISDPDKNHLRRPFLKALSLLQSNLLPIYWYCKQFKQEIVWQRQQEKTRSQALIDDKRETFCMANKRIEKRERGEEVKEENEKVGSPTN